MTTETKPTQRTGDRIRVLIAASGTGGHLFPALYIARALQRLSDEHEILFIGSGRPLEERIIDTNGFKRQVISISGVKNLGLSGFLRFLKGLPDAVRQTRQIMRSFKPDLIVGVGGYVSVLPVVIGWLSGTPTWIHEAELRPGLANLVLSIVASRTSTAFEGATLPFWARRVCTGHPVREELQRWERGVCPERPRRLLIIGGSQGARALDEAASAIAASAARGGFEIWHQTREENCARVAEQYKQCGVSARVVPFITDMAEAYRWCDLLISRAGAGSIMELGIVGKPAILVPYPFAQGDHQRKNAETLAALGKAVIVPEGNDFARVLVDTLGRISNPPEYRRMFEASSPARSASAADEIARLAVSLVKTRR